MSRWIKVELPDSVTDETYADIANTIWAVLNLAEKDYAVRFDGKADAASLNGTWDRYSQKSWESGV